jgi:predicted transposase YbfD/YdcC
VARITSRRRLHGTRAEKPFVRYYLLSKYIPAKKLLAIVRSHWAIENQLHWVLKRAGWDDSFLLGLLGHMR